MLEILYMERKRSTRQADVASTYSNIYPNSALLDIGSINEINNVKTYGQFALRFVANRTDSIQEASVILVYFTLRNFYITNSESLASNICISVF